MNNYERIKKSTISEFSNFLKVIKEFKVISILHMYMYMM